MTILERLYASSGSEVIHDTLQISAGDDNYWLTSGWDDVSVTLENGQPVTFEASAIDIALPARNPDGTQDLKFAISNIDGRVSEAIDKILDEMKSATLTFRRYISSDLSAPASSPYTLDIKSGSTDPDSSSGHGRLYECPQNSLAPKTLQPRRASGLTLLI